MRIRLSISAVLFVLLLEAIPALCQQLTIQTESGKPTVLSRADIESLPHIKVTASSGTPATFEGVSLKAVLERAGVGFGDTMRGKQMASCL